MNGQAFVRGVLVALLLAVVGAVGYSLLTPLTGSAIALRCVLLAVAAGCLLDLLGRAGVGAGRMLAATGAVLLGIALLLLNPPLWLWCVLPLAGLWLLQSRPLIAVLDAGLVLLGLAAALATARHTGSVGLALWSLLLLQALAGSLSASPPPAVDRFTAARRCAEAALQDLLSPRPSSRKTS